MLPTPGRIVDYWFCDHRDPDPPYHHAVMSRPAIVTSFNVEKKLVNLRVFFERGDLIMPWEAYMDGVVSGVPAHDEINAEYGTIERAHPTAFTWSWPRRVATPLKTTESMETVK